MELQTRKIGNGKANHKTDFYEIVCYFTDFQHTVSNKTFVMDSFNYLIFKDNYFLVYIDNRLVTFKLLTKAINYYLFTSICVIIIRND